MTADPAYRLACEGTALLWRGDYHNARLLLQALARRIDRRPKKLAPKGTKREPGQAFHLATYEHNSPCSTQRDDFFDVSNANEACGYILGKGVFAKLERPVSAICAVEHSCGFETACRLVGEGRGKERLHVAHKRCTDRAFRSIRDEGIVARLRAQALGAGCR